MPDETAQPVTDRSYGCSFGCGNPYDFIVIDVASGTTQFLCLPDYVALSVDMIRAVTEPDSPDVQKAVQVMGSLNGVPMNGDKPRKRGKNAPVDADDPDLIAAFDSVITVDELPDEFR